MLICNVKLTIVKHRKQHWLLLGRFTWSAQVQYNYSNMTQKFCCIAAVRTSAIQHVFLQLLQVACKLQKTCIAALHCRGPHKCNTSAIQENKFLHCGCTALVRTALHSHKMACCYVLKMIAWIDKSWDIVWKCAITNSHWWNPVGYSKHEAQHQWTGEVSFPVIFDLLTFLEFVTDL